MPDANTDHFSGLIQDHQGYNSSDFYKVKAEKNVTSFIMSNFSQHWT